MFLGLTQGDNQYHGSFIETIENKDDSFTSLADL